MCFAMASQFSKDGKYFAQLTTEGKLKIWDTISNTFEQEFTPDFHLTTPCTCLHFIESEPNLNKTLSPKKKKRKEVESDLAPNIVLGTNSGFLLIYSITKGDLEHTIKSTSSQTIWCLSVINNEHVYSGVENNVFIWSLSHQNVEKKWSAGQEKISAVLAIEKGTKLLTAAKNIKLWDVKCKEILKTFTGHSSEISTLFNINSTNLGNDLYFISGSKGDRLLNCWTLSEKHDGKNACATFLLEDVIVGVTSYENNDGTTTLAATVRSGVVHIFQHTLNGKTSKPLKPKSTVQVVSDEQRDDIIAPISITGALFRDDRTLVIGYGSSVVQTFENITLSVYKKLQCFLRKDPHATSRIEKEANTTKVRQPIVDNNVQYITMNAAEATSMRTKRKHEGKLETTMEKRLENLTLNKLDGIAQVPKGDNVAELLLQGLQSNDKKILQNVLYKKNEKTIKNTVKRLPMPVIVPLVEQINSFIDGKTLQSKIGALWMKNLIVTHAGILLANPNLPDLFAKSLGSIESRLGLQTPLQKLKGRLDLLVSQVNVVSQGEASREDEEALLVYNDKDSSDSDDGMDFEIHSSSDNEWNEGSSDAEDDDGNENEKDDDEQSNADSQDEKENDEEIMSS